MRFGVATICIFLAVLMALPASALVVDGKEIRDIYGYIIRVLEDDEKVQEQYREQAARNPSYRGYRPYTYSSLRHLTTEDLLYGALQGCFLALRINRGAPPEVMDAKTEANINVVMELFPMLARDFTAGEQLLGYMTGRGGDEYFRLYLLRRCEPGYARDSLFARFWQDCIKRHEKQYLETLEFLADFSSTDPRAADLAVQPLFAPEVVLERRRGELDGELRHDRSVRVLHGNAEGRNESTESSRILVDEDLRTVAACLRRDDHLDVLGDACLAGKDESVADLLATEKSRRLRIDDPGEDLNAAPAADPVSAADRREKDAGRAGGVEERRSFTHLDGLALRLESDADRSHESSASRPTPFGGSGGSPRRLPDRRSPPSLTPPGSPSAERRPSPG